MAKSKSRPGTMLYFDLCYDLEDYTDEEAGKIFRAMLNYGLNGEVPEFEDRGMRTLWKNIQRKIDIDGGKYDNSIMQRKYAAYCKKARKDGIEPLRYEMWVIEINDRTTGATTDNDRTTGATTDNDRTTGATTDTSVQREESPVNGINQLSTINYQPSTVNHQQSSLNIQQSIETPFPDVQTATVTGGAQRPPTLEQVIEYADSRGRVDLAEKFFDYYDAGDWRDKNGAKIWSWKQTFLAWAQREPKPPEKPESNMEGRDRPWHIETRDDGKEVIVYDD